MGNTKEDVGFHHCFLEENRNILLFCPGNIKSFNSCSYNSQLKNVKIESNCLYVKMTYNSFAAYNWASSFGILHEIDQKIGYIRRQILKALLVLVGGDEH